MDSRKKVKTLQPPIEYKNMNPFKLEEKRYKLYKGQNTDFSCVIDFSKISEETLIEKKIQKQIIQNKTIYKLDWPEGVHVVKNFLTFNEQIKMAKSCLNEYIHKPYRTNLFIYEENKQQDYDQEKYIMNRLDKYFFNKKIRWTNLGYQYNWNIRKYPDEKSDIHQDILEYAQNANKLLGLSENYKVESVIVNFYQPHDYMTGHLDDAEIDQESPIYSVSLGLSSIFLIGDEKKEATPAAIRLDSGDLLIMSKQSRRCYHGVPRIIEHSFQQKNPFQDLIMSTYKPSKQVIIKLDSKIKTIMYSIICVKTGQIQTQDKQQEEQQ